LRRGKYAQVESNPLSTLAGLLCGDIGQEFVVIPLQAGWIGRRFGEAGHVLRIIPAQFVKPHLKFNQAVFECVAVICPPTMEALVPSYGLKCWSSGDLTTR